MTGQDPAGVAGYDQQAALAEELLTHITADQADILAGGATPVDTAVRLADDFAEWDHHQLATLAGFAVVRLARALHRDGER